MRNFDSQKAITAIELEQMVVDYWREVDANGGANATRFFSEEIVADFGIIKFSGHEGVQKYYADRLEQIRKTQKEGIRTTRHVFHNLQVEIETEDRATLRFLVATYGGEGHHPIFAGTKPVSISDTRFECRRQSDGQWKIFEFFGEPIFIGEEEFARNSLAGK